MPIGDWYALRTVRVVGKSATPQRFSFKETLATPSRVQLRYTRFGSFTDYLRVMNKPALSGQRAYLRGDAQLASSATTTRSEYGRPTAQLSQFAQNRINVIVRRKLRTWNGSAWTAPVATRSIAWAMADVWTDPVYGDSLPDSRVDLPTLLALDQVWAARQDRFDQLFDTKITSWNAVSMMAQAGRSKPFRRYGVCNAGARPAAHAAGHRLHEPQHAPGYKHRLRPRELGDGRRRRRRVSSRTERGSGRLSRARRLASRPP